jgi:DNA invertase Pin-like site-specific DNA recombinase
MDGPVKAKRVIAYIRVSRVGDRDIESDSFQTVEQQRGAIDAIAKLSGAEVVDEVVALNASGGKSWPEPKLKAAIDRVDRGEVDGIAVYALDRWGRHLHALEVIERWSSEGKTMVSAADKFDASTASGRMCLRMMMVVARYYWEATKDRFFESQARAIDRGVWIGHLPFGYWRTTDGTLEVDPVTGPVAKEVFKVAAAEGLRAAMRHLGVQAPNRRWRTDETRSLLGSRAYLGESFLGKLVKTEAHDPLTTPETFAAVQALPEMTATPRRSSGEYPLSHIARCGKCGGGMTGQLQTVKGIRRRRLRCACGGGASITADGLEAYVRDRLGVALGARASRVRVDEGGLGDAREMVERTTGDVKRWAEDDRARDLMGDPAWYDGLAARAAAVEEAERRYGQVAGQSARTEVIPALSDLEDPAQFVRALAAMVRTVKVKPGRGSIQERISIEWTDVFVTGDKPENARVTNVGNPFQTTATEKTIEKGMKALAEGQRQRHPGAVVEPNLPVSHA